MSIITQTQNNLRIQTVPYLVINPQWEGSDHKKKLLTGQCSFESEIVLRQSS